MNFAGKSSLDQQIQRSLDGRGGGSCIDSRIGELASRLQGHGAENFGKANQRHGKWGMIVDPATRRIRSATPDHFMTPRWEHQEGRVWRFFTAQEHYRRGLRHMRLGDAYVHLARGFGSVLFAHACNGVRFENIVIHASPSLAETGSPAPGRRSAAGLYGSNVAAG